MSTLENTYTAAEFTAMVPEIDEATAAGLYSYFSDRYPVDGFSHFMHQKMLLYSDQYIRMQRDESVKYDAMVTDYLEARYSDHNTTEGTGTDKAESSGTTGRTATVEASGTTGNTSKVEASGTTGNTDTVKETTSGTQTTDDTATSETDNKELVKSNPMQETFTDGVGAFPSLTWNTSDTQTEHVENGTTTDKNTVTTSGETNRTDTSEGTHSDNSTTTDSGSSSNKSTTTESGTTGGTNTVERSNTQTVDNVHTERRTGRTGRNPAELLETSLHYITRTKSFAWLCDRLNPCFIWTVDL